MALAGHCFRVLTQHSQEQQRECTVEGAGSAQDVLLGRRVVYQVLMLNCLPCHHPLTLPLFHTLCRCPGCATGQTEGVSDAHRAPHPRANTHHRGQGGPAARCVGKVWDVVGGKCEFGGEEELP